ncbi:MAG: Tim44 domain-containing protein [Rhodospirillaceae bacterium]|nr:Tim44 domain-containing protein [Rhodospirillaceae bacterium]MBT4491057.1 Tim44 domain-containing protein [Rhodospirillaceae bacterium]MBT5193309.1 Tim44 domain-containing protein [Rhodospirillaceae bacterium]MBT5897633.1 Tim44 domain-containing protein [Rhodospirillaceae bacterium]MBT6429732.1 Tim44 domain-containing protein [Rhodospirillaceae bacterium]
MGEGHFLDIIFLAMVAGFIFFRLRGVLGRRTGNERPPERPDERQTPQHPGEPSGSDDNVVSLPDRGNTNPDADDDAADDADEHELEDDVSSTIRAEEEAALWAEDSPVGAGLTKIKLADHNFEPGNFAQGAKGAYEMIVDAFANGDRDALRPLLSDQVYENFAGAIDERENQGHTLETMIVAVNAAEIVEAELKDKVAEVTVKFVSEMVSVARDEDGETLPDQPTGTREVTDIWTFARDTRNRDPNWQLIETHGEN